MDSFERRIAKTMKPLDLPNGYYELPKGRLANVVTCLEMKSKPQSKDASLPAGYSLRRVDVNDLDSYRRIFRKVGEDLMWFSRLIMPNEKLAAILGHPQVESYALYQGGTELAFELPNLTRDMVVAIQGLVILFCGALERLFRGPLERIFLRRTASA